MKRVKIGMLLLSMCLLFGCSNENVNSDEVSTRIETEKTEETNDEKNTISVSWEDGEAPTKVGNEISYAKILDVRLVESPDNGMILVMDFEYTNTSSEAKNFINDYTCSIRPYQNGIELSGTGWMSEPGLYDCMNSFTDIKDGATLNTQLIWVLKDTINPVEIEFGYDEKYNPEYIKVLCLNGGENSSIEEIDETENLNSDYKVSWESGNPPTEIGSNESYAKIGDVAVVKWIDESALLIIDFEYTNNSENAKNFINDTFCEVKPYQNGIELDRPGATSENGIFDFTDAFTSIKKGATIKTQLVWILQDTVNPVEIEFGRNENYEPAYIEYLVFD